MTGGGGGDRTRAMDMSTGRATAVSLVYWSRFMGYTVHTTSDTLNLKERLHANTTCQHPHHARTILPPPTHTQTSRLASVCR